MVRRKIAVVGVGTVGAQALYSLAGRENIEVHGFERYSPGHANGAAGGEGRIFRRVLGAQDEYRPLIDRAFTLWDQLEQATGRRMRIFAGSLTIAPRDSLYAGAMRSEAEAAGRELESLTPEAMRRLYSFQHFHDSDIGLLDRDGGVIRSELANLLTAQAAADRGAHIHSREEVMGISEGPNGVSLTTDGAVYTFDQVIVTTGAWAHQLAPSVASTVHVHKPVSGWFVPKDDGALFGPGPVFGRSAPIQFYGIPNADQRMVKLGYAGMRQTPISTAPEPSDYFVSAQELDHFTEIVETHFPGLHPEPVRVNAYFEGYTDDARPVLQKASNRVTLALGFSGNGFKFAPALGEVAADLALDNDPSVDVSFLRRDFGAPAVVSANTTTRA
ncbi:FAD-dependent oxidoreductase [Paenarthrobacter nicotinovorans]|uniref:FAD-dependent oxidoreductase n=1 Tax=Paenarthrobacter nicotinovorans TaxID=29320 RepID=UPI003A80AA29